MDEPFLLRLPRATALTRALNNWFFDNIQVSDSWVEEIRELARRGQVVYVLRNLNTMDYLALDHLTQRFNLPRIAFANDVHLHPFNGRVNKLLAKLGAHKSQEDALRAALAQGRSAALFLKRPPGVLDVATGATGGRGLIEGDAILKTLIALQRQSERPIILSPQVILWTSRPNTQGTSVVDYLFGPREWPSALRTFGQLISNYRHVELRSGEPLVLSEFLASEADSSDERLLRKVVYVTLRRLDRERRSATGPAQKPPDRQRLQVLRSPRLQQVITTMAGNREEDQIALSRQALETLRELQATPNSATVKFLEVLLDRVFHRIYAGIDVDMDGLERLRKLAKEGTLVLLPSHKSHVDYLVVSFLFNEHNMQLPMIAAGDNLAFFPLGAILRRAGAFFIRRSFRGDRLYAATLEAYVRRLMRDGFTMEVFIEGGRSRTGKLLRPQMGMLSMLVDGALQIANRPVYFVPVSIGYERIVEAGSYEQELSGGEKHKEDAAGLLKSTEVLRHRYGRINIQFGQELTLSELCGELKINASAQMPSTARRTLITRLGNRTMDEINQVTAVTPGALTAIALLSDKRRSVGHDELIERCRRLLGVLTSYNARVTPRTATAGQLREEAIREAMQLFVDADLVEAHEPGDQESHERRQHRTGSGILYRIPENKRLELDTTKNHIVHFFVERGLVATAFLMSRRTSVKLDLVCDRVQKLSRLFKHEFRFRADASFQQIFADTLGVMERDKELICRGNMLDLGEGREDWTGDLWLRTYAAIMRNFIESYRIAARGLRLLIKGPMPDKDLLKKTLNVGRRMFLSGDIELAEAVSKPIIHNAFLSFVDEGYLTNSDKKFALTESFSNEQAINTIEGRTEGYLDLTVG